MIEEIEKSISGRFLKAVENGQDIMIEVDVRGADKIRAKLPEAISIFVMPPSFKELNRRLTSRGTESPEIIAERMKNALDEIKRAAEYDYIVVNDDIDIAVDHIISVIESSHLTLDYLIYCFSSHLF